MLFIICLAASVFLFMNWDIVLSLLVYGILAGIGLIVVLLTAGVAFLALAHL